MMMHGRMNVKCGILVQDLRSLRRVTLKMEAERSTETSVNQRTHRHKQDNWNLRRNCCRENIEYYAEKRFLLHSVKYVLGLHSKHHVC
jgi:hypothetical protein